MAGGGRGWWAEREVRWWLLESADEMAAWAGAGSWEAQVASSKAGGGSGGGPPPQALTAAARARRLDRRARDAWGDGWRGGWQVRVLRQELRRGREVTATAKALIRELTGG